MVFAESVAALYLEGAARLPSLCRAIEQGQEERHGTGETASAPFGG